MPPQRPSRASESRLEELRDAEETTEALTELESAVDPGGLLLEIKQLEHLVERLGHVRDSKAADAADRARRDLRRSPAGEGRRLHAVHRDPGLPGRDLAAERLHGVDVQRADEPGGEGGGGPQLQGTGSGPDLDRGRRRGAQLPVLPPHGQLRPAVESDEGRAADRAT